MFNLRTAVVLAGGMGTRLQSVIGKQQKCLTMVGGKPFIFNILESLKAKRISRVILATGFMSDSVENLLGNSYDGMDLIYSVESLPLKTGGALIKANKLVTEDHYLALNGDSIVDFSLKSFLEYHFEKRSKFSMLLTKTDDAKRFGSVELDTNGKIISFKEKENSKASWINAGVYLIDKTTLDDLAPTELSLEIDIFPTLINDSFFGFPLNDVSFVDIGTPSSLSKANSYFISENKNTLL